MTKIGQLTTEEYRRRLAGAIDPQEAVDEDRRVDIKYMCIAFAGVLPELYGQELEREKLWERIGSGLEAAFAKTAGADHEFFIQAVLEHIKASPSRAAANENLAAILEQLAEWEPQDRAAWIVYFHTHLIPVLVAARYSWGRTKDKRKARKEAAQ